MGCRRVRARVGAGVLQQNFGRLCRVTLVTLDSVHQAQVERSDSQLVVRPPPKRCVVLCTFVDPATDSAWIALRRRPAVCRNLEPIAIVAEEVVEVAASRRNFNCSVQPTIRVRLNPAPVHKNPCSILFLVESLLPGDSLQFASQARQFRCVQKNTRSARMLPDWYVCRWIDGNTGQQ